MNDDQLLRYSRQIMLPEVDIGGQESLLRSHALIVGLGGLGSPIALYLAAAGIGRLTLLDHDDVELSNLQRQIVHRTDSIGRSKVASAATAIAAINPDCQVEACREAATPARLDERLPAVDLVLDGTDNFATRHLINAACQRHRVPLISGAAIRWEGQIAVFDFRADDAPCYACLFPNRNDDSDQRCASNGVAAPVVGVIGALQALEAVKLVTGAGHSLSGALLVWDGKRQDWQRLRLNRNPDCPVCGATAGMHDAQPVG